MANAASTTGHLDWILGYAREASGFANQSEVAAWNASSKAETSDDRALAELARRAANAASLANSLAAELAASVLAKMEGAAS